MKLYHAVRCVFPLLIVFGLAPLQAAVLNIQRLPNQNDVELSWPDLGSNKVYTLQQIQDLNRPLWEPLLPWDDWPIQGTTYVDPLAGPGARFYRLAATERGRVIAITYQATITKLVLNLFVIPTIESDYMIDIPFMATYDVDIYRVDYETLDGLLGPTQASGALCVPSGLAAPADLLSYQHGTIYRRADAPSDPSSQERIVGEIMASDGFVVAMPDLLGLGPGSTGLHPYVHRRSSATAVVDMLRATRTILATDAMIRQDVPQGLSDKLFLLGYSQGGYVTLAAQQEMEQKHASEFHITASAPSDGPYDLSGTMAGIMTSTNPYPSPSYLPYVLLSYNPIYHLFDDPAQVMIEPYATTLPPLFDGEHTGGEIDAAMPASMVPSEILQPTFLDAFTQDPNNRFHEILRENDLWGWAPVSPTRLFHCADDEIVPFANAQVAYDSFIAAGADPNQVMLIDPNPNGVHATCLFSAVPLIVAWFESLR